MVEKAAWYVQVSDEFLVDSGNDHDGSAAARLEARAAESRARWLALPWHVRLSRTVRVKWSLWQMRREWDDE